ncbi:hypothetical protein ACHAWF_016696 [Thalassiosira exigua]
MPWYEPSARAPPTPHRSNRDGSGDDRDAIDLERYLDETWDYRAPSSSDDGIDRRDPRLTRDGIRDRVAFDGFQSRVEGQLGGIFPLAGFPSSHCAAGEDRRFARQSSRNAREVGESFGRASNPADPAGGGGGDPSVRDQNEHPNLKREGDGAAVSKAAQFFHPRPVMALMPYRHFFSPLQFPAESEGVAERKPPMPTGELGGILNDRRQSQAAPFRDHAEQGHRQTPAETRARGLDEVLNRSHVASTDRPTSSLEPKDLFDAGKPSKTSFKKRTPKQAKLVRDSRTGQVMADMNPQLDGSKTGENRNTKSWDDYGGRAADKDKIASHKEKAKDKKQKKSKSNRETTQSQQSQQSTRGGDIEDFLTRGKKRPSDEQVESEANAGKSHTQKTRQKKQKRNKDSKQGDCDSDKVKRKSEKRPKKKKRVSSMSNSGTELEIPAYDVADAFDRDEDDTPTITEKDFDGIEQMEIRNAGQCMDGMERFLTNVGRQRHVAFSMLFLDPFTGNYTSSASGDDDGGGGGKRKRKGKTNLSNKYTQNGSRGYECTSPFLPTSKSYCTPKGPKCTAWNCTCENQIRAMRGSAMLLGALFVFQNGESNNSGESWECYLLPLGPTKNCSDTEDEVEYPRMSTWPVIPFECDVSLSDRWSAFEALLLHEGTKMVTYNAPVSLLPFYHHLSNDVHCQTHMGDPTLSKFAACLAGTTVDSLHHMQQSRSMKGSLRSVWDVRLISWMMRPHATDSELEFSTFQEGFAHLAPDHQHAPSSTISILLQGVLQAKNDLELCYALYPIMNKRLVDGGLLGALESVEVPFQSILSSMESRGVAFLPQRLKEFEHKIETRIEQLEAKARSIVGDPDFLISSPQQVSAYLFDVLKLTVPAGVISKTKAGSTHRSTSEETLKAIKAEMKTRTGSHPQILDVILEFRGVNKMDTTFIKPLPKFCRQTKRSKKALPRIYPQWMQTAVRTGRLSCRKPNLQQIPKEGAYGVIPRHAFSTEEGMCLFACDYSQKVRYFQCRTCCQHQLTSLFAIQRKLESLLI